MSSDQKLFIHVLIHVATEMKGCGRIHHIFGIAGDPITPLIEYVESRGIKYYGFRNEQAASYAASSISFLSRGSQVGVCLTVAGPGMVNALTGCGNAQVNEWPMLLVCPFTPNLLEFQYINQIDAIKGLSKGYIFYQSGKGSIQRAIDLACTPPYGCVVLFVPKSPPSAIPPLPSPISVREPFTGGGSLEISPNANVLAVIGSSVVLKPPEVYSAVRGFVESNKIPFVAESMARGIIEESHALCVSAARSAAFRGATVAILIGTKLDWMLSYGKSPKWNPDCEFIVISDDPLPEMIKGNGPMHLSFTSLMHDNGGIIFNDSWRSELLETAGKKKAEFASTLDLWRLNHLPTHIEAMGAIKRAITISGLENALVVSEGANTMDVAKIALNNVTAPCKRLDAGRWGTMGSALGFVIAAQALVPDEPVICIQGDSAFGFSGMEIETIVRYKCKAVIVVFNNGGIYTGARDNATSFTPGIKHNVLIEAFGGYGFATNGGDAHRVLDEMLRAFDFLKHGKYPILVDVDIDPASGSLSGSLSRL